MRVTAAVADGEREALTVVLVDSEIVTSQAAGTLDVAFGEDPGRIAERWATVTKPAEDSSWE